MDFSKQDADAGVLCHVDQSLVGQIDATLATLRTFERQLALANCDVSKQLGFGEWLKQMQAFCSGAACPSLPAGEQNLFAFLSANEASLKQLTT